MELWIHYNLSIESGVSYLFFYQLIFHINGTGFRQTIPAASPTSLPSAISSKSFIRYKSPPQKHPCPSGQTRRLHGGFCSVSALYRGFPPRPPSDGISKDQYTTWSILQVKRQFPLSRRNQFLSVWHIVFVSLPLRQRQSFTLMDQRLCLWKPPGPSRALDPLPDVT